MPQKINLIRLISQRAGLDEYLQVCLITSCKKTVDYHSRLSHVALGNTHLNFVFEADQRCLL